MKILLHIGFHKTGSSSIQDTLATVRQPGFAYLTDDPANHSQLLRAAYYPTKDFDPARAAKSRLAMQSRLSRIASDPSVEKLVISAEATVHIDQPGLEQFHHDLAAASPDISVLGYLRPLSGYMASAFQQILKVRFMSFDHLQPPGYQQSITRLDAVFGQRNVTLLPFAKHRLTGGDVVLDFCGRAGIAVSPEAIVTSNESLPLEGVALLYLHRKWHTEPSAVSMGRARRDAPFFDVLQSAGTRRFTLDGRIVAAKIAPVADSFRHVCDRIDYSFEDFCDTRQQGIASEAELLAVVLSPVWQEATLPQLTGTPFNGPLDEQHLARALETLRLKVMTQPRLPRRVRQGVTKTLSRWFLRRS